MYIYVEFWFLPVSYCCPGKVAGTSSSQKDTLHNCIKLYNGPIVS